MSEAVLPLAQAAISRRVINFVNVAHACDHLLMLIFPTAVLGMGSDFGLGYGDLLALSVGSFVAFGIFSLPAGWLGDRWSRRDMLAVFFIGSGATAILTGFATQPWHLAAGLTLIGMFAAIYHPVGNTLIVAHAEKLGRAMGINGVWGNLGIAFAALLTGTLVQWFGWRFAYFIPGAVFIGFGVAYLLLVPRDIDAPKRSGKRAAAPPPRAMMIRALAILALVSIAGGFTFNVATLTLPKLIQERIDLGNLAAFGVGATAAVIYTFGAVAQLLIGGSIDKLTLRRVFLPLSILQAPCLFLAGYAAGWPLIGLAAGIMFGIFGQVTVNDAMMARYTAEAWRSRAYGVRYVLNFGSSAVAVPVIGWLHERSGGLADVYSVAAVFGLVIFIGALAFPHRPEELAPSIPQDTAPRAQAAE